MKFDLTQTVRQVEQLSQAVGVLLASTEQAMGRISQFSGAIDSVVSRVSSTTKTMAPSGVGPTDYITSTGSNLDYQRQKIELEQYNRSKELLEAHHLGVIKSDSSGRLIGDPIRSKHSVQIPNLGNLSDHQKIVDQYEMHERQQRASISGSVGALYQGRSAAGSAYEPTRDIFGVGVRQSDIPQIMKQQVGVSSSLGEVQDFINKFKDSEDRVQRTLATTLERVSKQFLDASAKFDRATDNFEKASHLDPNDKVYRAREAQRDNAAGRVRDLMEEMDSLRSQTGGGGGGGGRGGIGGWLRNFGGRFGGSAAALLMAGSNAYGTSLDITQSLDRASIGARTGANISEMSLSGQLASAGMESRDLTSANNILRYYGTELLPGMAESMPYLGRDGFYNALDHSRADTQQELSMSRRQRNRSRASAWTKGILGVGGMVGGLAAMATGVAAPVGLAAFGAGAMAFGSAFSGGVESEYGSEYSQYMGDSAEGMVQGVFGSDEYNSQKNHIQRRAEAKAALATRTKARSLQDANLQGFANQAAALQMYLDVDRGASALVGSVGSSSLTRQTLMGLAAREGRSPFERFEISPADFQRSGAGITSAANISNSFGEKRTAEMTERMYMLSRVGIGDIGALTGNLAGMTSVGGGSPDQILNRLEAVMEDAISVGFDKSRTGQQFVQTSTRIADSLNIRNIQDVSRSLSDQALAYSLTPSSGVADERGLRSAARGIQSFNEFTSQSGGFLGAGKIMDSLGSGASYGQSMVFAGLGSVELSAMLEDLNAAGGNIGSIQNNKLKGILSGAYTDYINQRMSKSEASRSAFSKVRGMLSNVRGGTSTRIGSTLESLGIMDRLRDLNLQFEGKIGINPQRGWGPNSEEALRGIQTEVDAIMEESFGIPNAGFSVIEPLLEKHYPEAHSAMQAHRRKQANLTATAEANERHSADVANQGRIAYFDEIITQMSRDGLDTRQTLSGYERLLKNNTAGAVYSDESGKRFNVSAATFDAAFKDEDSNNRKEARRSIAHLMGTSVDSLDWSGGQSGFFSRYQDHETRATNIDIIRSSREMMGADGRIQNVQVTNFEHLAKQLSDEINKMVKAHLEWKDPGIAGTIMGARHK